MRGNEKFALWLAEQLDKRNYSNNAFAKRIGVSQSSVGYWVTDRVIPNPDNCRRIADALGIPRDEILRRAGWLPNESGGDSQGQDITNDELQAMNLVREAKGKEPVTKLVVAGQIKPLEEEIGEFLAEFPALRSTIEFARAMNLAEVYIRALMYNIRVFAENPQARAEFVRAHGELQKTFLKLTLPEEKEMTPGKAER